MDTGGGDKHRFLGKTASLDAGAHTWTASREIRYLAIVVFFVTVVKLFTVDFAQLDSVYRIASSIALGLLLVGSSYLYQRYESRLDVADAATEAPRPDPPADGS